MVRPTDYKTIAIERQLIIVPKRRGRATKGHRGRHPGQSGGKRSKGKVWTKAFSFCWKDWPK